MNKTINIAIAALVGIAIVAGTVSTANKRKTALYGHSLGSLTVQLPNRTLVQAWGPSDQKIIDDLADYARSIAPRQVAKGAR